MYQTIKYSLKFYNSIYKVYGCMCMHVAVYAYIFVCMCMYMHVRMCVLRTCVYTACVEHVHISSKEKEWFSLCMNLHNILSISQLIIGTYTCVLHNYVCRQYVHTDYSSFVAHWLIEGMGAILLLYCMHHAYNYFFSSE